MVPHRWHFESLHEDAISVPALVMSTVGPAYINNRVPFLLKLLEGIF